MATHLHPDKDIFLHSENGVLGMDPAPALPVRCRRSAARWTWPSAPGAPS
jgi:acyl CoA:acetate/3-ketoacid CoA transferase beta subunit